MTKLRLSLRNLAKAAPAILNLLIISSLLGCSLEPNHNPYTLANLSDSLVKIARDDYKVNLIARLVGQTLWVYLPLEESLFIDADKPQEYSQRYEIKNLEAGLNYETLSLDYAVSEVPETKESQNKKFNPEVADKINKTLRTIRRALFNLKPGKYAPRFFVLAATDIKTGIELIDTTYIDDIRKVSYDMISWVEYQHRTLENVNVSFTAIGDKKGRHIRMRDIDFQDFLLDQIKQRIQAKFSRNEVGKGADVDEEVLKTIKYVLEIYKFKDFLILELKNSLTRKKVTLSRSAVLEKK